MIYFSELWGKKVYTEDNVEIGSLEDLIFLAADTPKITKLVVRTKLKEKLIIQVEYLKKLNSRIILRKDYNTSEFAENELHLVKNVLDKQIIDLVGNKMVRVNDAALQDKPGLYLAGVDVGFIGILRWFKIANFITHVFNIINIRLTPRLLSWVDIQPLELARGKVVMKKEEEKLEQVRPEDLADYLEKTNLKNIRKILNILDEGFAAEVIGNLNINYQSALFRQFNPQKASRVINSIYPDEAVDIILTLSKKKREKIISYLPPEKKKEIEYLLSLSKTPIGNLITSEYVTIEPEATVSQIISKIRQETSEFSALYYIYVINKFKQLVGVFNLYELLLQNPETPVYKFMVQNVIVAHLTSPVEIVIKKMLKYKIQSIPIINEDKNILGIVAYDDLVEFILEKI